jgi:hypothetical protein
MSSHPDPRPPHASTPEPDVIVIPYRPSGSAAVKLLPPLLIMMLGAGFLAYRSHSADWRGLYAWFGPTPKVQAAPRPQEAPAAPVLAKTDTPAPAAPVEPKPAEPKVNALSAPPAAVVEAPKPDPLDDIEREAAQTKDKIAALEKLKERASKQLDETARDREQDDRLSRRIGPRFRRAVPPGEANKQLHDLAAQNWGMNRAEIDKQIREEMERFDRLKELMERRQMALMNEMQGNMFNNGFQGRRFRPPAGFPPMMPRIQPLPVPDFGPNGKTEFHEFQGLNGARGFVIRRSFRGGNAPVAAAPDEAKVPPPPEPAFPGRDDRARPGVID